MTNFIDNSNVVLMLGFDCDRPRDAFIISKEGSVQDPNKINNKRVCQNTGDLVIVTYWQSYVQHEVSHVDKLFNDKFSQLAEYCNGTYEVGYSMLWQGTPEHE